jgi:hypothetical protein
MSMGCRHDAAADADEHTAGHSAFCIKESLIDEFTTPPDEPPLPTFMPTPAPCDLCGHHSCHDIEKLDFSSDSLTVHQVSRLQVRKHDSCQYTY